MSPSVSTEARGWREALTTREVVVPILVRAALAPLLVAAAFALSGPLGTGATFLGTFLLVLVADLARLRVRGR